MTFCKIFESDTYGQILVMKDIVDGFPAVSVRFVPEGMGLSGPDLKSTHEDEDKAWAGVDKVFDSITLHVAESTVAAVVEIADGLRKTEMVD